MYGTSTMGLAAAQRFSALLRLLLREGEHVQVVLIVGLGQRVAGEAGARGVGGEGVVGQGSLVSSFSPRSGVSMGSPLSEPLPPCQANRRDASSPVMGTLVAAVVQLTSTDDVAANLRRGVE